MKGKKQKTDIRRHLLRKVSSALDGLRCLSLDTKQRIRNSAKHHPAAVVQRHLEQIDFVAKHFETINSSSFLKLCQLCYTSRPDALKTIGTAYCAWPRPLHVLHHAWAHGVTEGKRDTNSMSRTWLDCARGCAFDRQGAPFVGWTFNPTKLNPRFKGRRLVPLFGTRKPKGIILTNRTNPAVRWAYCLANHFALWTGDQGKGSSACTSAMNWSGLAFSALGKQETAVLLLNRLIGLTEKDCYCSTNVFERLSVAADAMGGNLFDEFVAVLVGNLRLLGRFNEAQIIEDIGADVPKFFGNSADEPQHFVKVLGGFISGAVPCWLVSWPKKDDDAHSGSSKAERIFRQISRTLNVETEREIDTITSPSTRRRSDLMAEAGRLELPWEGLELEGLMYGVASSGTRMAGRKAAAEMFQCLVAHLRDVFRVRTDRPTEQRQTLTRRASGVRILVKHMSYKWASECSNPMLQQQLWQEALTLDIEMAQRMLRERFLAGASLIAPYEPAAQLVHEPPRPAPQRAWLGHRHHRARSLSKPPHLQPCSTAASNTAVPVKKPAACTKTVRSPEWIVAGEMQAGLAATEQQLAKAIGEKDTILLRATFDIDGRLIWTAAEGNGTCLRMIGHHFGGPMDKNVLGWAATKHDIRSRWAYMRSEVKARVRGPLRQCIQRLLAQLNQRDDLRESMVDDIANILGDLRARLSVCSESFSKLLSNSLCCQLQPPVVASYRDPWRRLACSHLTELKQLLEDEDRARFPEIINRITKDFLTEISQLLDLGPLAKSSSTHPQLVAQLDGELYSVPLEHLPVGGGDSRALFEVFESIRTTLSAFLDPMLLDVEANLLKTTDPPFVATISSFPRCDPASAATPILLHGQHWLARERNLPWCGAEEGAAVTLRSVFQLPRVSAATVSGHGDYRSQAMRLATGEMWNGTGQDLNHMEYLIIASCMLGRVPNTGLADIEGFLVDLFLQNARSILAARWDVQPELAAEFANEVVKNYLDFRKDTSDAAGCLGARARATNAARRTLMKEYGDLYLNTSAAFGNFGLA